MQAAVEEVAQLYGNPTFLQVFTNDAERASELKRRLNAAQSGDEIVKELAKMKATRDELLDDIALKEKEAARLSAKLVRQRAALDALATALDQARTAVEDTTK
jgi:septal ring factor EnvC (AmiA/AmiB activator)